MLVDAWILHEAWACSMDIRHEAGHDAMLATATHHDVNVTDINSALDIIFQALLNLLLWCVLVLILALVLLAL